MPDISFSSDSLLSGFNVESVKISHIEKETSFGLCLEPIKGIDLTSWASVHKEWIEFTLQRAGALLFRGFDVRSVDDFERFIVATSGMWTHYREAATPRTAITQNIATSTEYPAGERILLHNENSHCTTWPGKIYFWCEHPAESGGETPIADCRKLYNRIEAVVRQKFIERSILYVRNFTPGLGIPWEKSLNCRTKSEVESYSQKQGMKAEWISGDHLRLEYLRPAVIGHPVTRELIWFNHATFFNIWAVKPDLRKMLLETTGLSSVPYNTFFGDSEPLTEELVGYLMDCYDRETVTWPWRQGDILLLDNMLIAHGRMSFTGKRRVLTGMADSIHYKNPSLTLSSD
jgi:alpha-ketoglutarate-dependent taurine dioxygenase